MADFVLAKSVSQEEHQFGDRTFGSAVIAADHARLQQLQPCLIPFHLYGSALALGDVDDDNASAGSLLQLLDEPWLLRSVA